MDDDAFLLAELLERAFPPVGRESGQMGPVHTVSTRFILNMQITSSVLTRRLHVDLFKMALLGETAIGLGI